MKNFIKKLFLSTMIIALIGVFPFLAWGKIYWLELLLSFSISVINAIAGYYLVLISINKSDPEFYKNVYGGMLIRMAVVFGVSIYIILNKFVFVTPFMLFLLLFYVLHQWLEISGWLRELPIKKV